MIYTSLHNEKELLSRVALGDKEAFKLIYDHYWNNIYHTALSYLKSTEWAQDIVQDTFLKLWEKREGLVKVEKLSSYIFIIVRNQLVTALRRKLNGVKLPESYLDSLPSNLLHPEATFDSKSAIERIEKAVAQLSPQQQQIFRLTREAGLSHEQIAERLGIEKRTVSNHATTALNKLRQWLKDDPELYLMIFGTFLPVLYN